MDRMMTMLFYHGGWIPECCSSTLEVEGDRLFGRRGSDYCEILPTDVVAVEEFGFNNPFALVMTSSGGRYHVGALSRQYDDVVRVLERNLGSSFSRRLVHRMNVFFYRRQFRLTSLVMCLFGRRRTTTTGEDDGANFNKTTQS